MSKTATLIIHFDNGTSYQARGPIDYVRESMRRILSPIIPAAGRPGITHVRFFPVDDGES